MRKLGLFVFVVAFSLAFSAQSYGINVPYSTDLDPTADCPVYDGSGWADYNFDNYTETLDKELWTGDFGAGFGKTSTYFMFNLAPITPGVQSAYLFLYKGAGASASDVTAYSTGSGWVENAITWNNQPGLGTIGNTTSVGTSLDWYAWDVTAFAQAAGTGTLSLALSSTGPGQSYFARETGTGNSPYLRVTAAPEPISSALFLIGGAAMAVRQYRKRRKS